MSTEIASSPAVFPELPFAAWQETCETLHLFTQIVGKIRLAQTPWLNHSWHVTLYVNARGLTTGLIPHANGKRSFELEFDFVSHRLRIAVTDGNSGSFQLGAFPVTPSHESYTVATFYSSVMGFLDGFDLPVKIHTMPSELPNPLPLDQDTVHATYDREYAHRFWEALVQIDRVFKEFRTGFIGKCSPVHFFWGSFDLAVTRFSGRTAPRHPGGVPHFPNWVAREAYSHEVCSAGFWPGNAQFPEPIFYSYAYPEPPGYAEYPVLPDAARYDPTLHEFVLPYEAVRLADDPDALLLEFLQSSYEAAADLGNWDRATLERKR